jgi:hypothetical protein
VEVPELLSVRDVAAILKLSPAAVTRRFESYPGVIDVGSPETRSKRRYALLRIPAPVLQKYLNENKVA